MKDFLKKSFVIFAMLFSIFSVNIFTSTEPSYADIGECRYFLGMPSWDCGIESNPDNEEQLKHNVRTIAENISTSIARIAAYLVVGYVIYGGYLYITSSGDPNKTAAGKKTLTNAFIGLAIVGLVNIILNAIHIALLGNAGAFDDGLETNINASEVILSMFHWFIGIAGIVAAVFVVLGAFGYITSSGDAGKLQKAKSTIVYALIGLIAVALSFAISNFFVDVVNNAGNENDLSDAIGNIIKSFIAIGGVVALGFIVFGGFQYMTSTGDATKIQKAKTTILYAVIGLVVAALAFTIVNFTIGIIKQKDQNQNQNQTTSQTDTILLENSIAFLEEKL